MSVLRPFNFSVHFFFHINCACKWSFPNYKHRQIFWFLFLRIFLKLASAPGDSDPRINTPPSLQELCVHVPVLNKNVFHFEIWKAHHKCCCHNTLILLHPLIASKHREQNSLTFFHDKKFSQLQNFKRGRKNQCHKL